MKLLESTAKLSVRLWEEETMAPFTDEIVNVESAETFEFVWAILVLSCW